MDKKEKNRTGEYRPLSNPMTSSSSFAAAGEFLPGFSHSRSPSLAMFPSAAQSRTSSSSLSSSSASLSLSLSAPRESLAAQPLPEIVPAIAESSTDIAETIAMHLPPEATLSTELKAIRPLGPIANQLIAYIFDKIIKQNKGIDTLVCRRMLMRGIGYSRAEADGTISFLPYLGYLIDDFRTIAQDELCYISPNAFIKLISEIIDRQSDIITDHCESKNATKTPWRLLDATLAKPFVLKPSSQGRRKPDDAPIHFLLTLERAAAIFAVLNDWVARSNCAPSKLKVPDFSTIRQEMMETFLEFLQGVVAYGEILLTSDNSDTHIDTYYARYNGKLAGVFYRNGIELPSDFFDECLSRYGHFFPVLCTRTTLANPFFQVTKISENYPISSFLAEEKTALMQFAAQNRAGQEEGFDPGVRVFISHGAEKDKLPTYQWLDQASLLSMAEMEQAGWAGMISSVGKDSHPRGLKHARRVSHVVCHYNPATGQEENFFAQLFRIGAVVSKRAYRPAQSTANLKMAVEEIHRINRMNGAQADVKIHLVNLNFDFRKENIIFAQTKNAAKELKIHFSNAPIFDFELGLRHAVKGVLDKESSATLVGDSDTSSKEEDVLDKKSSATLAGDASPTEEIEVEITRSFMGKATEPQNFLETRYAKVLGRGARRLEKIHFASDIAAIAMLGIDELDDDVINDVSMGMLKNKKDLLEQIVFPLFDDKQPAPKFSLEITRAIFSLIAPALRQIRVIIQCAAAKDRTMQAVMHAIAKVERLGCYLQWRILRPLADILKENLEDSIKLIGTSLPGNVGALRGSGKEGLTKKDRQSAAKNDRGGCYPPETIDYVYTDEADWYREGRSAPISSSVFDQAKESALYRDLAEVRIFDDAHVSKLKKQKGGSAKDKTERKELVSRDEDRPPVAVADIVGLAQLHTPVELEMALRLFVFKPLQIRKFDRCVTLLLRTLLEIEQRPAYQNAILRAAGFNENQCCPDGLFNFIQDQARRSRYSAFQQQCQFVISEARQAIKVLALHPQSPLSVHIQAFLGKVAVAVECCFVGKTPLMKMEAITAELEAQYQQYAQDKDFKEMEILVTAKMQVTSLIKKSLQIRTKLTATPAFTAETAQLQKVVTDQIKQYQATHSSLSADVILFCWLKERGIIKTMPTVQKDEVVQTKLYALLNLPAVTPRHQHNFDFFGHVYPPRSSLDELQNGAEVTQFIKRDAWLREFLCKKVLKRTDKSIADNGTIPYQAFSLQTCLPNDEKILLQALQITEHKIDTVAISPAALLRDIQLFLRASSLDFASSLKNRTKWELRIIEMKDFNRQPKKIKEKFTQLFLDIQDLEFLAPADKQMLINAMMRAMVAWLMIAGQQSAVVKQQTMSAVIALLQALPDHQSAYTVADGVSPTYWNQLFAAYPRLSPLGGQAQLWYPLIFDFLRSQQQGAGPQSTDAKLMSSELVKELVDEEENDDEDQEHPRLLAPARRFSLSHQPDFLGSGFSRTTSGPAAAGGRRSSLEQSQSQAVISSSAQRTFPDSQILPSSLSS